jgi:hypothetical protein
MNAVFDNSDLLMSVSRYAYAKHAILQPDQLRAFQTRSQERQAGADTTFLFLQIFAAAEYYSLNKSLMNVVPPVHVDIILDPYLLNVFPKSLGPTAIYIVIIAIVGWFLSGWFWEYLILPIAKPEAPTPSKSKKTK